jgi:hypothetical protein
VNTIRPAGLVVNVVYLMNRNNRPKNEGLFSRAGGLWILLLVLVSVLGALFWRSFDPAWVQFANDGPLGAMMSERAQLPEAFTGSWGDLNGYGSRELAAIPHITIGFNWLLGPLGFSKFYPPLTLLILGACAWFCFRQLGLDAPASVLGGLAAALSPDFFNVACWGVGSQAICFGMNYLALGVVASPVPLRPWVRYPLAGLAVGMGVMEGADIGAIFSVTTALLILIRSVLCTDSVAKGLARGVMQVGVVAVFAAFVASAALSSLIGTQIEGVAGMSKQERTKEEQWEWATQLGSLPKLETLGVLVPGVFGYGMASFNESQPPEAQYWGKSGRHPAWDSYLASGKQGPPPGAGIRFGGAAPYAGVLVLLVAAWAIVQSLRKGHSDFSVSERRFIWVLAAAVVVCLLLAFGRHAPFYRLFFALPYASTIRIPMKFYHVVQWMLLVLFAYGLYGLGRRYMDAAATTSRGLFDQWNHFWQKGGLFERRWVIGCTVALGVFAVGWLAYASFRNSLIVYLQDVLFDAATARAIASFSIRHVGGFVVLFALAAGWVALVLSGYFAGRRAVVGASLLGAFLILDLTRVGSNWVNPYNWKERYVDTADNAVIQFLRQTPNEHRVTVIPGWLPAIVRAPQQIAGAQQLLGQVYGTEWLQHVFQYYNIQSLDIIQMPRRPQDIAAFESALQFDGSAEKIHLVACRWQLTNTRYLLCAAGLVPALDLLDPGQKRFHPLMLFDYYQTREGGRILTRTNSTGPFALVEFTGALPRAKLYSQWQVNTNAEATLALLASKEFNPLQTVLVADPLPSPKEGVTNSSAGTVEFKSYAPKRIVLNARADVPSVLLLNDKHDPNWHVLVDGKPAPLLRCNFIMRGVFLEPGEHTVEFKFQPPVGALYVSLAAIALGLLLLGFAIADTSRRPSSAAAAAKPA